jgi:hypothetical protein
MPIPKLTENGFLPHGIFDSDFSEIENRFGKFQKTDRRILLFEKLKTLFDEVSVTNFVEEIIIDGSFISVIDYPNDIDLVVVLKEETANLEIPFWIQTILDSKKLSKKFQFDVVIVQKNSIRYFMFLDFFQDSREGIKKGVVRVKL